jgi:hypothetical protein
MTVWEQTATGESQYLYGSIVSTSQQFSAGQEIIGEYPQACSFNFKKVGNPPSSATFQVNLISSSNVHRGYFGDASYKMEDFSTSFTDNTFTGFSDDSITINAGDYIGIVQTGSGSDGSNSIQLQMATDNPQLYTAGYYESPSGTFNALSKSYTMSVTYGSSPTPGGSGTRLPPPPAFVRI